MLDQRLLEILRLPEVQGRTGVQDGAEQLDVSQVQLIYEVRDDIPVMLVDEAKPL